MAAPALFVQLARSCQALWHRLVIPTWLALLVLPGSAGAAITVTQLRCEYAVEPLGIGVRQPRLSWVLESSERGQRQTAWQILVASGLENLRRDQGDLWDSGRVNSDQSIQIVYSGRPLPSRQRCFWKVRVWAGAGQVSPFSEPACWEMGLVEPTDWQADWIGMEQRWPGQATWGDARWIWHPESSSLSNAPPVKRFFRRVFHLPKTAPLRHATVRLTADCWFDLRVNGKLVDRGVGKPYSWKFIRQTDVTEWLRPGANVLAITVTNRENTAGLLGQLVAQYQDGSETTVVTDKSWKSANHEERNWQAVNYDDSAWGHARELARPGDAPWKIADYPPILPCPFLRKSQTFLKPIEQARLYASALGVYEFHINGRRVGDDVFNPGWTDYNRRVQYHTYDVTELIGQGPNAFGIVLGDGWYAGFVGLGGRCRYGTKPLALAQLEVDFQDGTRQSIYTDHTWKAATGPLLESDMLMGECYDARLEMAGWNQAGFDDRSWEPVAVRKTGPPLVAACDGPVRRQMQLKPRRITAPGQGKFVFDLGQNMVGCVRLRVKGQPGTQVRLRYGEMLNPDGTIYTENLREARCLDYYTLRGGALETYEPHFTFHGFRYVELSGFPGAPDTDTITGIVLHSDTPPAGRFECSNPTLNRLYENIVWGQRGNFLSIPTDCPQRDERLGWTGDAQVFIRTATYNMEVARFFTKWLVDLEDAQRDDGAFPDVAPSVAASFGTAAWGDAGTICPWTVYQVYGDTRILEKSYAAAVRWVEFLAATSTNLIRPPSGYGDWLSIAADTRKDVLATAYFAQSTRLVANMAKVLNKTGDARKYSDLHRQIVAAFNRAFVAADGKIAGDTQTACLMALEFGLLPEEREPWTVKYLAEDIAAKNDHLSTGFVGVGMLMPVLTRYGQVTTAYRLLNQDTFPSWLYSVKHGATTIWERWDGWTADKGFQTAWMNSFNHYSLGSVGAWLFETVAGIGLDSAQPGFKRIIIHPQPGGGLTWAKGEYQSMHGKIASAWRMAGNDLRMDVTIPANTRATVYVPAADPGAVLESGQPAAKAAAVRFLCAENGFAVYEVGSGNYRFRSQLKPVAR